MQEFTRKLWDKQNQHPGDRGRLFHAVSQAITPEKVLYAGSYVDVAPSFVFPDVTYVDVDRRAKRFFDDEAGVMEIINNEVPERPNVLVTFIQSDYAQLSLPQQSFDLLISLYAGFISDVCTDFLKLGGHLLVNPSHGDAALASIDARYQLAGAVVARAGGYRLVQKDLETYLQPKKTIPITRETLVLGNRGIAYTRPAFAYLFQRVG